MPTIDIAGVPHFYQDVGMSRCQGQSEAPTIVFVHGWLLSHHYWQPLMAQLADTYSCLSYDLRGFGNSIALGPLEQPAPSTYDLASYAQDLNTLLDQLKIERAWLVGHSLGGSIAIWAAHLYPERIQGVTCVNAGGGIYLKTDFERFRSAGEQLVTFRPAWLETIPFLDLVFSRMMVQRPLDKKWGKQRLLDLLRADAVAARRSLLESTTEEEVLKLPQLVADLKQPLHFLAGKQDKVMEVKYVNYLASFHTSFYPLGKNVIMLDRCGHFAMLEQLPLVAQTLRDILSEAGFK